MDITMCENNSCPSKEYCFRFTAIPNEYRQSYTNFVVKEKKDKCEQFLSNNVKCEYCHQPDNIHKMSCKLNKITMFYNQMEKEVHQNNSNLNQ